MQASTLAVTAARARIAIGIVMVAVPGRASRLMGGEHGDDGSAPVFLRMLGARDIALGLGTVVALDRGAPVRGWLEGSALADAGDVVASVLGRGRLTPNGFIGTAGIAAVSTVLGALLARRLDPPPPPDPGHPEAIATGHHPASDAAEPSTA
jgi:hypothetical protein